MVFGIGNFSPVSLLATAALGPAGGLAASLTSQLYASIGQEIIGRLGAQLGLPQASISLAQNAFAAGSGNFPSQVDSVRDTIQELGSFTNASPSEIGEQQRTTENFISDIVRQSREQAEESQGGGVRGTKGQGWLMAMAKALGAQLDKLGAEMEDMAGRITKDTPSLSAEFSVVSQQFNMLMSATTNAIKTVGEAMGNAARKN